MKASKIINRKNLQIGLLFVLIVGLNSCGSYQSAYNTNDDGIYASKNQTKNEVAIVEKQSNFDHNYFSNQLEDLQNLKKEDTFTEIDDYFYDETPIQDESLYTNYNAPWEYADGDVVVNINSGYGYMSPNYYWYNPFYQPYYGGYYPYYYNPWRYNYYNPYYSEFYGYYGNYYNPYYSNYYYNYPYSYGRNYDSYGKRSSYNTNRRENSATNLSGLSRRSSTESDLNRRNINSSSTRATNNSINRNSNTINRNNNSINRNNNSNSQPSRSNNTIQRGSNSIQRSSSTRRNSAYDYVPSAERNNVINRSTPSANQSPTSTVRVNPNYSGNQNSNATPYTPNAIRRESNTNEVRRESNTNEVRRESNTNEVRRENNTNEVRRESNTNEVRRESNTNEVRRESNTNNVNVRRENNSNTNVNNNNTSRSSNENSSAGRSSNIVERSSSSESSSSSSSRSNSRRDN